MDIIRYVLLATESEADVPELRKYDQKDVVYNIVLMQDAGLLHAVVTRDVAGDPVSATIVRLTWAGHEFLDAVRDDSVWQKAKANVLRPAASWSFGILVEWLKHEIKTRIPGLPQ